jgi:hypothetical protein
MSLTDEQQCEIRSLAVRVAMGAIADVAGDVMGLYELLEGGTGCISPHALGDGAAVAVERLAKNLNDIRNMVSAEDR